MKTRLAPLLLALAAAGCAQLNPRPPVDVAEPTSARPEPVAVPVVNNGAIFQGSQYRPLFEDHRARLVGDTITVVIVEKVSASQKSSSTVDKNGSLSASVTDCPAAASGISVPRTTMRSTRPSRPAGCTRTRSPRRTVPLAMQPL